MLHTAIPCDACKAPQFRTVKNDWYWRAQYWSTYWNKWVDIPRTENQHQNEALSLGYRWFGITPSRGKPQT